MSLVPDFQIGWLNAWVLLVASYALMLVAVVINKDVAKRLFDISWYTADDKKWASLSYASFCISVLYSIAVPLKLGTTWFYIGGIIYLVGFIVLINGYVTFATTPADELVVKGVYKISRHPLYFFTSVAFLGAGIASASWLLLLLSVVSGIFTHLIVLGEERRCLETYGDAYREYMDRVPRYFLFF